MDGGGGIVAAPSGTVTFLFTDIEGSTPLWDSFPDAMGAALARHDEILRGAIDANGGHVFSTGGDGLGAAFSRAANAIAAALAAQRDLAAEAWSGGPVLRVRMGVHTGEAEERDGDFFGPAVNRAARIMGAANGGQVVVSEVTAGIVRQMTDATLVDLGSVKLKGVVEPLHVFGVAGPGHDWIDIALLSGQVTRGNLPRLQTEFVGDLAGLQERVSSLAQARVVTLTGSGGVGKTRAAVEIGWLVVDEFVDGVWLVELAPVADPALVIATIASTLGANPQPGSTLVESIVEWCVGRRMLLIIDNCEHVLHPVIELVSAITANCPTVTVIATSREPLGVPGETVTRIPSLEPRDGVELFVERARSADTGFEPDDADLAAIVAVCERVDGIPLAIELAAARIRSLSPTDILQRLDDRFRLLRGGGRGGLERHQTLRATATWSYQLLGTDAQVLFDRLSVFAGSFDLDAAETICAGDGLDSYDIVDVLGDLVDKSMVNTIRTARGTRYRLLETLRQYGEERLEERAETARIRDAHLHHYATLAEQLGQQWFSPDQAVAGGRFDDDWDNLGAAHAWAITSGSISNAHTLFVGTADFAIGRVRSAHHQWGARTLELADTTGRHDATTLYWQGMWAFFDGDLDRAVELGELAGAMDTPDAATLGRAVSLYAHTAAGRSDTGKKIADELRSTLPTLTDPIERLRATVAIVWTLDPDTIDTDADAALAATRAVGAPYGITHALRASALRWLFTDPPDFDRMIAELDEAIRLNESVGTSPHWEWMWLVWGRTLARDPAALDTLHRAVLLCYDHRQWAALDVTLEAAPSLLVAHDPVVAATIYGYLEPSPPPYGAIGVDLRAVATEHINDIAEHEAHRSLGAAMDREQILTLTVAALDDI